MTVPIETSESSYTGNGVTDDFSTGFYFVEDSHVVVKLTPIATGIEATLVLGVDYTVTLPAGVGLNGTVSLTTPPANNDTLVIERTVPVTQEQSLRSQGSFSPAIHEDVFDYGRFIDQQLARRIAVLEALAALVSIATFDGQVVEFSLFTDAVDVENSFPFNVAIVAPVGKTVTGVTIVRVSPLGNSREPVMMLSWDWAANLLTVNYITGLEPNTNYTFRVLATHMEP